MGCGKLVKTLIQRDGVGLFVRMVTFWMVMVENVELYVTKAIVKIQI